MQIEFWISIGLNIVLLFVIIYLSTTRNRNTVEVQHVNLSEKFAIYDYMYRNDMTFSYDDLRDYSYYQWYKLRYETSPKSKFAPEPILNDNAYREG
ncbi:hypothetical protein SAMN04487934_11619 [Eubacterium ruminantium]|nr:hypothetical protein SAMN04487934_11619 [Eubacterium ruminantium]